MSSSAFSPNVGQLNYSAPIGSIVGFAVQNSPIGWLECNGASLDTSLYSELFSVLGYTYGGSGSSFSLPDYRGEFLRGWDHGKGTDSGRSLGTSQNATRVYRNIASDDGYGNAQMDHDQDISVDYDGSVESSGFGSHPRSGVGTTRPSGTVYGVRVRPKNISIMYCIKYSSESVIEPSLNNVAIGELRTTFLSDQASYFSGSSKWLNLTSNTTYDKTINPEYGDWFSTWNILTDSFITEIFDDRFARLSDSRAVGNTQEDAFQAHQHRYYYDVGSSIANVNGTNAGNSFTTTSSYVADGGGTPRTADETRPKNIAAKIYVKIA